MTEIGPMHWFTLSTLLFSLGIYGLLTRRNAIGVLISTELMINSAALNFIVFNRYVASYAIDGSIMVLFIIAIAAAEAVVAMAIFVALFRNRKTVDVTQINEMTG